MKEEINLDYVYNNYNKIIEDLELNIQIRKKLLLENVNPRYENMLNMLNDLHLAIKDDVSVESLNRLLLLSGVLIFRMEHGRLAGRIVCEICVRIYFKFANKCDGKEFHNKYVILWELYRKITSLLNKTN